ncbi:MAG: protoheme IX farnesyltransferase [Methanomicrobiales archaeon]|nr:protoheme IX farnesyltransferase [Methanomicrobiales archaeon]
MGLPSALKRRATEGSHRDRLLAYLELTKPKVVLLNLLVGLVSFVLAAPVPPPIPLCIFLVTGYLAAGGCGAINCWYDRDIDRLMARTSERAIPREVLSPRQVLLFGSALLTAGLLAAAWTLPGPTALMMAAGAGTYLIVYTVWLKRTSPLNVVLGGAAVCFAAFAGWTAAGAPFPALTPVMIALLGFFWTPGHFWALAVYRDGDYRLARIPMLPARAGRYPAARAIYAWNVATVGLTLLIPVLTAIDRLTLVIMVPAGLLLLHLSRGLLRSPSDDGAVRLFSFSIAYLLSVLLALLVLADGIPAL